jgi:hypothetical protein
MPTDVTTGKRPAPLRKSHTLAMVAAAVVVLAAVAWSMTARNEMRSKLDAPAKAKLEGAERALRYQRDLLDAQLRTYLTLLVEDPRLKSTLATPGIDRNTIADILSDLRTQTGLDLIGVLGPDGRVQAVLGAEQFRGLDMSSASLIRKADSSDGPVSGVWLSGERTIQVAAVTLRVARRVVAFLIVGGAIDTPALQRLYTVSEAGMGMVVDGRVTRAAPESWMGVFTQAATDGIYPTKLISTPAGDFWAKSSAIENTTPPVRVVALTPAEPLPRSLDLLLWIPTAAALIAAFFVVQRSLMR